jgi:EAL domain-containing protein (putative c-di-GMP-specific phosphodiesterase class I)
MKLAKLGCEEIQGYYVSKALGKDDLEEFLKKLPNRLFNC